MLDGVAQVGTQTLMTKQQKRTSVRFRCATYTRIDVRRFDKTSKSTQIPGTCLVKKKKHFASAGRAGVARGGGGVSVKKAK